MTLAQPRLNLPRPLAVTGQMTYALITSRAEPSAGCGKSPDLGSQQPGEGTLIAETGRVVAVQNSRPM